MAAALARLVSKVSSAQLRSMDMRTSLASTSGTPRWPRPGSVCTSTPCSRRSASSTSRPRRPLARRSSSPESAMPCSSSMTGWGTRNRPCRKPERTTSSTRPSMATEVSTMRGSVTDGTLRGASPARPPTACSTASRRDRPTGSRTGSTHEHDEEEDGHDDERRPDEEQRPGDRRAEHRADDGAERSRRSTCSGERPVEDALAAVEGAHREAREDAAERRTRPSHR